MEQTCREQTSASFAVLLLKLGVIEKSQAVSTTQVHLVPKPGVKTLLSPDTDLTKVWRFCLDYRFLNSLTEPLGWPLPNIEQMLRRIGSRKPKFFAVKDLVSGYHCNSMRFELVFSEHRYVYLYK